MKIFLPETIKNLIKLFKNNKFKCFVVGGGVRDSILNISPKEFDLCTDAHPSSIKSLFEKHIDIGEKYGCIKVYFENNWFEITTFRVENGYKDFRHAENIKFVSNPFLDSHRRDFTINSIYFDGEILIDPFNGIKDIKNKIINLIGDKDLKFKEDPLRILRALKFKSKLNFNLNDKTFSSLKKNFSLIKHLTKYRVHSELSEIFENPYELPSIEIFNNLNGFEIIFKTKICIYNFKKISDLPCQFHIKIFSLLYFHSNINKFLIPSLLKENLNFSKKQLKEINLIYKLLLNFNSSPNKIFIKNLIFKYDYTLSLKILKILCIYIFKTNYPLKIFFEIKWGFSPIKINHLNINLGKIFKDKKNVTKYNKYLITLVHLNPKLNKKHLLKHLVKTKL